jgi:multiple sugar transport system permease protein
MTPSRSLLRRTLFWIATALVLIFFLFPLYWIFITAFKDRPDIVQLPPRFVPWVDFQPTLFNFHEVLVEMQVSQFGTAMQRSEFPGKLLNSVVISGTATVVAVILGTLAAYAFSRFRIKGEGDLLFFILSTRMLPPVVTVIPLFLMFKELGMRDTLHGITLLYITMGLPFVVWMMKGFFDEVPREFEEAAMIDGYSRAAAIWKIVIPEVIPPMLATAVFVLITAWNEFVFVQLLNPNQYTTTTPFLYGIVGYGRTEWGRTAATTVVFVAPIVLFTFLVRKYLLRGVTFGAVRR